MDTKLVAKAIMITWAGYGVVIENSEDDVDGNPSWKISVPATSVHKNVDGIEMAGKFLARRFKQTMIDMGAVGCTVSFRIRPDDNWDDAKRKSAEDEMKRNMILGA